MKGRTEVDVGKRGTSLVRTVGVVGILVVALLTLGTFYLGRQAQEATEDAVQTVSLFYLDELAGRREDVVASNLRDYINNIHLGIDMMGSENLGTMEQLQAFQARMKKSYNLEKFAFVDRKGLIYTSVGVQYDIHDYPFDPMTLSEPEIHVRDLSEGEKTVIVAVPIDPIPFEGEELIVCFTEMGMDHLLSGVSLQSDKDETTFCNIYTREGVPLTNLIFGGQASEANVLEALRHAELDEGYDYEDVVEKFTSNQEGTVSFTYEGIPETFYFIPIEGTSWMLTYLIRASMIVEQIQSISQGIITRSLMQTILLLIVLLVLFSVIIQQTLQSAKLTLEKEKSETEGRIKREELEARISLQEQLLLQEKQKAQLDEMITALASDYRSVYYVDLESNEGICFRDESHLPGSIRQGEHFPFLETFTQYAQDVVAESYRKEFLSFIDPSHIRTALKEERLIVYRYLTIRDGQESYEMLRMAGVAGGQGDEPLRALGVGFTDIDVEMRKSMEKSKALKEALDAAEEANRAKTAFLSSMSHEMRTPMNAIIGLDNIALNDTGVPDRTREYLEKIGSSAQHLLNIINDILDMSRIESGRMSLRSEEFSFSKLIEQVNTIISGQCQEKGLDYECHVAGEVDDEYIGDEVKLRQVLINILGNAVKFTPSGGQVRFGIERTAQYEGRSTLRFTIADTGIGMSKEYLPKIFESFSQEDSSTTNRYGSTGLGLAITKNIVQLMNGTIEVESEKGKGSCFTVTLTLQDALDHSRDGRELQVRPQDLTVLVIDDDPVACEHAQLVLSKVGIYSESATSGAKAVEMVRLRHARGESYNVILVDWAMPEMDGGETTRQIRKVVGNESAIIFLTAYHWDDIREEAMDAGVDSFIQKPLFAGNVLDEFREAIWKKKAALEHSKRPKADLNGRKVLLAEDMQVNAEIMEMVLSMKGIVSEHAVNGQIAVDMFASQPPGTYDAILMDVRMPVMDGLTATRTIRALDREDARTIPIIALTANAFDEDVQRSLQAGLNAHLSKPVQPETLFEVLEDLIPA